MNMADEVGNITPIYGVAPLRPLHFHVTVDVHISEEVFTTNHCHICVTDISNIYQRTLFLI